MPLDRGEAATLLSAFWIFYRVVTAPNRRWTLSAPVKVQHSSRLRSLPLCSPASRIVLEANVARVAPEMLKHFLDNDDQQRAHR